MVLCTTGRGGDLPVMDLPFYRECWGSVEPLDHWSRPFVPLLRCIHAGVPAVCHRLDGGIFFVEGPMERMVGCGGRLRFHGVFSVRGFFNASVLVASHSRALDRECGWILSWPSRLDF